MIIQPAMYGIAALTLLVVEIGRLHSEALRRIVSEIGFFHQLRFCTNPAVCYFRVLQTVELAPRFTRPSRH